MRKAFVLFVALMLVISCKNEQEHAEIGETFDTRFNVEMWPEETMPNAKALEILNKWPEYIAFEASFERIYEIENTEDLSLIIEDLIEELKEISELGYPEDFDKPHIKSRLKALKTYILKTKESLEYRLDVQEPVIEMIDAFNALQNQFNVIVNNTFDAELILEGNE